MGDVGTDQDGGHRPVKVIQHLERTIGALIAPLGGRFHSHLAHRGERGLCNREVDGETEQNQNKNPQYLTAVFHVGNLTLPYASVIFSYQQYTTQTPFAQVQMAVFALLRLDKPLKVCVNENGYSKILIVYPSMVVNVQVLAPHGCVCISVILSQPFAVM